MTTTIEIPKNWRASLGSFSKAIDGSVSLNFSESGGSNCDNSCKMKAKGCYAIHTEKMKPSVATSGERKRVQGVVQTCLDYINQLERLRDNTIPWIRFSTFGSVQDTLTQTQKAVFTKLLIECDRVGEHIHFPVETEKKRKLYQSLCDAAGLQIVVRISAQTLTKYKRYLKQGIAASIVFSTGDNKKQRLVNAEIFAHETKTIVCPAVKSTILKQDKVKCGDCIACSVPSLNIIYPQH